MTNEDNRFDGILMTIIQQKGNIDGFFDSVFGFLRRNTDFFANQKKAEEIIVNNCKTNFQKYTFDQNTKKAQETKKKEEAEKKKKQKEEKQRLQKEKKEKQQQKKAKEIVKEEVVPKNPETEMKGEAKEEKDKKDDQPAPKGNGGRTEKFIWIQTLEMLQMFIFLPKEIGKKDIKVTLALDKLKVICFNDTLIDSNWKEKISLDDSFWTIEDGEVDDYKGKYLHVTVEKWKNQNSWWSTPLQGYSQINTQKINPQPSKLSDLDGETRSTVQKMMFDMKQKQQGLPSSDQLQKQDKLKQFMKSHPEMDFSQCKFN